MNIRKLYKRASPGAQRDVIRMFWGYWLKWGLLVFAILWIIVALIEHYGRTP